MGRVDFILTSFCRYFPPGTTLISLDGHCNRKPDQCPYSKFIGSEVVYRCDKPTCTDLLSRLQKRVNKK